MGQGMLKTPKFWYPQNHDKTSILAALLIPIARLYQVVSHRQIDRISKTHTAVPVICVGNIVAGGAGKTPVTMALAKICTMLGVRPHILTRGYGGQADHTKGHVVSKNDAYPNIGDEALLMARTYPVCVAAKRQIGARKITEQTDTDVIIMDDGLQNRDVHQDVKILVIDGASGLGNGLTMPSGPLRETLSHVVKRIDAVVMIGVDKWQLVDQIKTRCPDMPIFMAEPALSKYGWKRDQKYVGFCGLGRPDKFLDSLKTLPISIADFIPFADHQPYTNQMIENMLDKANRHKARLITTEKDMIRIPIRFHDQIDVVPLQLAWQDDQGIQAFLAELLERK